MNPIDAISGLSTADLAPFLFGTLAWLGIGLFGNVATRLLRQPLRWLWPRRARLTGMANSIYRWLVRALPILSGAAVGGLVPGIWPEGLPNGWGPLLGSTAGLFSLAIFHAIEEEVPLLATAIPRRIRGWLLNDDDDDDDGGT